MAKFMNCSSSACFILLILLLIVQVSTGQIYLKEDHMCRNTSENAIVNQHEIHVANMGGNISVTMSLRVLESMEKIEECSQEKDENNEERCTNVVKGLDSDNVHCNDMNNCTLYIPLNDYADKVDPKSFTSLTLRRNKTQQNYLVWPRELVFKSSQCTKNNVYKHQYNLSHKETHWFANCSVS